MGLFDWNGNGRYDMFDAFVTRSFFKSVEKAERKARRREEFWEGFWETFWNGGTNQNRYCRSKYQNKSVEKWKPCPGFIKFVKVWMVLFAVVLIYAKISSMQ